MDEGIVVINLTARQLQDNYKRKNLLVCMSCCKKKSCLLSWQCLVMYIVMYMCSWALKAYCSINYLHIFMYKHVDFSNFSIWLQYCTLSFFLSFFLSSLLFLYWQNKMVSRLVVWGLTALWEITSLYIELSPRERERERDITGERKKYPNNPSAHLLQAQ